MIAGQPLVPAPDQFIAFELGGEPVPKGRPRSRIIWASGKPIIQVYTPKETENYEKAIALSAKIAMHARPPTLLALTALVEVFLPVPASWTRQEKADALSGALRPSNTRADADNFLKKSLKCAQWGGVQG